MGLGLSFGSKSNKSSGVATIDKDTVTSGSQTTSTTGSNQSNTSSTGTSNTNSSQTQNQQGTQNQTNLGQTTNSTTGTTTSLDQGTQDALAAKVQEILGGGVTGSNIDMLSNMIAGRGSGFDAGGYVSGVVGQARNRGEQLLQEQNSAFGNAAGGSVGTNSMAALMAQRGRADLESNIAGVEAQANQTAQGILNQNLQTAVGAQTGVAGIAESLAGALKGGTTTTDMTQLTDEISQLIGKSGTTGTTTGSQNTATAQNSSTTELLSQIANILSNQTVSETGTETQSTKGKSGGFGASLGL